MTYFSGGTGAIRWWSHGGFIVLRVALIEDDPDQAELYQLWLEADGHDCRHFGDGESFLRALGGDSFDIVLLDWIHPKGPCRGVRRWRQFRHRAA